MTDSQPSLPDPDASSELVEAIESVASTVLGEREISAQLKPRLEATKDIQTAWVIAAFDYGLDRRVGDNRDRPGAFSAMFTLSDGTTYPAPIDNLPEEALALWESIAAQVTQPLAVARFNHLLFLHATGTSARTVAPRLSPTRPLARPRHALQLSGRTHSTGQ